MISRDAGEMVGSLAQVLKQASREAKVLLCAPALDPNLSEMAELANPGVLHLQ